MKGTAIVIGPTDTLATAVRTGLTAAPTLEFLQRAVGGFIETVPHLEGFDDGEGTRRRCVAYCNEEGKLSGLPPNPAATALWAAELSPRRLTDVLVGPVVLFNR